MEGLIAFRETVQKMLPDQEVTVRATLEIGDQIVGYLIVTQTDPTTGQPFTIGILDMVRIEGGKAAAR